MLGDRHMQANSKSQYPILNKLEIPSTKVKSKSRKSNNISDPETILNQVQHKVRDDNHTGQQYKVQD
jgi:hypothetical protein